MDIPTVPYPTLMILFAAALLLSGIFSGAKSCYFRHSKSKLKAMSADGKKSAKSVLELSDNEDMLKNILHFGNFLANTTAATFITLVFLQAKADFGMATAIVYTLLCALALLFFGEITPKTICSDNPEKSAMFLLLFVQFFYIIFYPPCFLVAGWKKIIRFVFRPAENDKLTEEELINIVEEAEDDGDMDEHESELIRSAIEFNDLEAGSILTPRVDIIAIEDTCDTEEISEIFRSSGFSRLPVYHEKIDDIIGLIHEKDFNRMIFEGKNDLKSIIHDVVFITESMKISKVLRKFQDNKVHMAVVVDEFGGTAGIVTLEDVLEGLVGDIWDEHDEVINDFTEITETEFSVSCNATFDDFCEKFSIFNPDTQCSTVGALVIESLAKIPEIGDSFDYENLHCEVTKTDGRRAVEIKVTVSPEEAEQDSENENEKNDNNNVTDKENHVE